MKSTAVVEPVEAPESRNGVSRRTRLIVLAVVVVLAVAGAAAYVLRSREERTDPAGPSGIEVTDLAPVAAVPHLAFRSTALGQGYGRVAVSPLSDPDGPRALTPASCDRLYARSAGALCLVAQRGLVTSYRVELLGPQWTPTKTAPLQGLPSRARMSPDGARTATTTFVYGDSYARAGQFSTRTIVGRSTGEQIADIETFRLTVDGRAITAVDRNMWGVTFAGDGDTFYATAASGGKTWLTKGSISAKTLTALREDVECPSLSPDGNRIAFKKHGDLPAGKWRLAVYDLTTGRETVLAEDRSVDDQVEWLDNTTVLYGLPRTSENGAPTADVWAVPADGSGKPAVLVHDAWSPAVVRHA
jgi:hypothetical protein